MARKKYIYTYLLVLTLPFIAYTQTFASDTTQNAAKRFTLQDLLRQGQAPSVPQDTQATAAKTETVDLPTLLAAAQNAAASQQQNTAQNVASQFSGNNKNMDIDVTADKNGNINLADLPAMLEKGNAAAPITQAVQSPPEISLNDLQSLLAKQNSHQIGNTVVKEELNLGKEKIELEAAGKRTTHYTLVKGADGGLNLVPVVDGVAQSDGHKFEVLQPKGYEEKGNSRQQMQLTTLSQALYSPFPSDQNTLHLHLKGKDGKDGKPGAKGHMGPIGAKGPEGPHGLKGDAGTCSSQINGLFECTPDELDSLSNRVDYLEKICKKVENASKKHKVISNSTKSSQNVKEKPKKEKEEDKAKEKDAVTRKEKVKVQEEVKEQAGHNDTSEQQINEKGKSNINKQKEKTEKVQEEKAKAKVVEDKKVVETTGEKKNVKENDDDVETKKPLAKKVYQDPVGAALRSMIDVRAKLKIAELDLMDRVKQAQQGVMKTL